MIKCKICGGQYSNLEMHLTHCLKKNNVTREGYNALPSGDELVIQEGVEEFTGDQEKESGYVSPKDLQRNIFKGASKDRDPNRPLSEALKEFNVSEEEFLAIMKRWHDGAEIPIEMVLERREAAGENAAKGLSVQDRVNTSKLEVAEALVKNYGFVVLEVQSAKGGRPKTWVLNKKKA